MLSGEYEFNTDQKEIIEIISGGLEVLLPGSDKWKWVEEGDTFEVPAQSKFELKVKRTTDYCCSFVDWIKSKHTNANAFWSFKTMLILQSGSVDLWLLVINWR